MPLAAMGSVPLARGNIGMSLSSILVVLNSMRVMRPAAAVAPTARIPLPAAAAAPGFPGHEVVPMSTTFILIPLSLVLVEFAVWAFFRAVGAGQFDELDAPAWEMSRLMMIAHRRRRRGIRHDVSTIWRRRADIAAAAFAAGLAASLHCVAMCGGIAGALGCVPASAARSCAAPRCMP